MIIILKTMGRGLIKYAHVTACSAASRVICLFMRENEKGLLFIFENKNKTPPPKTNAEEIVHTTANGSG